MGNNGRNEYTEMGALRWLLLELRQQRFHNSTQTMALLFGVREREIATSNPQR